ncbi:MAG: hypothetical protein EXX96DRAFT_582050 [Benjaminiella poitrasii]|nr:MAG: hypothetical protein EXX96DRAFT_582050 [Benjaminiella poitrasii]
MVFPVTSELSTTIVAQIKARIHSQIISKISATIFQKVKANLHIKASIMGGVVKVGNAQIEAIQTAAVNGLQTQMTHTIEKKVNQVLSETVTPKIDQLLLLPSNDTIQQPESQMVLTTPQLTDILMDAETLARSELQVELPEIQKTLKTSLNSQLKAQIKGLKINIPGVLQIDVSAKLDVTSSINTVVHRVYKMYANVSLELTVQSYVKQIQQVINNNTIPSITSDTISIL